MSKSTLLSIIEKIKTAHYPYIFAPYEEQDNTLIRLSIGSSKEFNFEEPKIHDYVFSNNDFSTMQVVSSKCFYKVYKLFKLEKVF